MGECMRILVLEVVLEVVYVQVSVREGLSRGDVEVADDLVDLDAALKAASLLALGIEVFSVVLAFALLDTLTATERPRNGGIGVTYFIARVAAASLLCVGGSGGAVAFAAVVGGKMGGFVSVSAEVLVCLCGCRVVCSKYVQIKSLGLDFVAALLFGA